MAKGDAKIDSAVVGAAAEFTITPPSGEERLLLFASSSKVTWVGTAPDKLPDVQVKMAYEGSVRVLTEDAATVGNKVWGNIKVLFTNTNTLTLNNGDTSTQRLVAIAIQTK